MQANRNIARSGAVTGISGQDTRIALWVFAAALALRAFLHAGIPEGSYDGLFEMAPQETAYRAALVEHPFAYMWYEHTLPILHTARNLLLHNLFRAEHVGLVWFSFLIVLNSAAAGLLYLTGRELGLRFLPALVAPLLFSTRLVLWETWSWGAIWDCLNPFLVVLYFWTMTRFLHEPSSHRAWAVGAAGGVVSIGFQFGLPIVAGGIAATLLLLPRDKRRLNGAVGLLALPVLLTAAVIGKNAAEHGLWSPSSGAGQNIMQNYNMALSHPEGHGSLELAKRKGYPDWWVWCYEEAVRNSQRSYPVIDAFYGKCMFSKAGWIDYSSVKAYLAANPDWPLADVARKDIAISENRPWLWDGPVYSRATGLSLEYGKISQRLLFDVLVEYPRNFAGRVYTNLKEHFLWNGALYGINLPVLSFEPPMVFRWINLAAVPLYLLGAASALVWPVIALWVRIRVWRSEPRQAVEGLWGAAAVSAGFLAAAAASAFLACCDNNRHAFAVFPVALLLAIFSLHRAVSMLMRRFGH